MPKPSSSASPRRGFIEWMIAAALCAPAVSHAALLWSDGTADIGSTGYLRAGVGESAGHTQSCFQAPGAGAKYRLGNECEVYGRASLYYRHRLHEGNSAPYLHAEAQPEFNGPYGDAIEYKTLAQAYVEIGNLGGTQAKAWVGRRYYKRRDVHINDYFYMNLKGDGFGVRDIPIGPGDLAYTFLRQANTPTGLGLAWPDEVATHNHEFGLHNVAANPGGTLMFDVRLSEIQGETFSTDGGMTNLHPARGWAATAQHGQRGVLGGSNIVALQYGRGAARNAWTSPAENAAALGRLTSAERASGLEAAHTWRLVEQHLHDGDRWAMQSAFIWERRDSLQFDGADQTWISLGARPMYYLDDHWRLLGEAGYDKVSNRATGTDGHLWKITAAIEWAPRRGFLSRPALRAYVTRAAWSESFRGQVGGSEFADATSGWNAGLQLEAWW